MDTKLIQISIVVPTYNESESIPILIQRITDVLSNIKLDWELIIVDDDSPDGTWKMVEQIEKSNKHIRLIHRKNKTGLSSAVLDGIDSSNGVIVGVMDADLSHPPETIPELLDPIVKGSADFVMGSRYIEHGSVGDWGITRKIFSRLATLLASKLTDIKDPMSGYFFFKKDIIKNITLNPRGFKIGLEILIKGYFEQIKEVPYKFSNRHSGESKVTLKVITQSLVHIFKLYVYKYKIGT